MDHKYIIDYYNNYDEEARLGKRHGQVEFLTTIKYVEKYLQPGMRILEVGAGTGRYSLYFSKKGHNVDSVELVEHNIDVFRSKMENEDSINLVQGNALNLEMYKDNTFDITMVLGPLYHVYTQRDKEKVVEEAVRVTKPGGKIVLAYITHDAVIIGWGLMDSNLKAGKDKKMFTDDYKCISNPEDLFAFFHVKDFNALLSSFPVKHLHTVATDGVSPFFANIFKNMSMEEFDIWMDYHYATCEREDLIGYSNHVIYIGQKK